MENFESYFKKQQADSNCGFAEEYEVCALSGESSMTIVFKKANQLSYGAYMKLNEGEEKRPLLQRLLSCMRSFSCPDSAPNLVEMQCEYFAS